MFDPKLYREACRELTAPEDKMKEIITMAENTSRKKVRPLRTALIAAASAAVMVAGVAAANPEGVREIVVSIASAIEVGGYRADLIAENGENFTVYFTPQAGVENRDGRAILVIDGKDAADITEELNEKGRYDYECTTEGKRLKVTVEGTVDQWTAKVTVGGADGFVCTFSSDSESGGSVSSPGTTAP